MPKVAQTVVPVSLLFSSFYTFFLLSRNQETIILQASGVNLWHLCWPSILIASFMTGILIFFNISLTPRAEVDRRLIREQVLRRNDKAFIYEGIIYRNPGTRAMWYVQKLNIRTKDLEQAEIVFKDDMGHETEKWFIAKGHYEFGHWLFKGVRKFDASLDDYTKPTDVIPEVDADQLQDSPLQIVAALRPPDEMTWPELDSFLSSPSVSSQQQLAKYFTEDDQRIAYPFLCIVFCLFGISFGLTPTRRDASAALMKCLSAFFGVLVWFHLSIALGNGARLLSWIAAWNSVVLFGGLSIVLWIHQMGWTEGWKAVLKKTGWIT
jgi:lipopolysaccharide export system permease protein